MLKALPRRSPGLEYGALKAAVLPLLPEDVFPDGARAGWWIKLVQLDLEAKGVIAREKVRPLRWRRV
ncbi:MAG TPA: hypothetical protein VGR62_21035 [Candidatus Binatia bacterium]|jgi:hypothetical protein|nr:hypothetical protein [Candidatus Binatia bacterium]